MVAPPSLQSPLFSPSLAAQYCSMTLVSLASAFLHIISPLISFPTRYLRFNFFIPFFASLFGFFHFSPFPLPVFFCPHASSCSFVFLPLKQNTQSFALSTFYNHIVSLSFLPPQTALSVAAIFFFCLLAFFSFHRPSCCLPRFSSLYAPVSLFD